MSIYTFTSESVTEGHPDKVADQVSDAILDAHIAIDPHCRVACETLVKDNRLLLAGEISSQARIDHEQICRDVVRQIGYDRDELGFNADTFEFLDFLGQQSPEIAASVNRAVSRNQGAGDQGLVFGYACHDTTALLPAPIYYAHTLTRRLADLRHRGVVDWLRPDAKSQVSLRYRNGKPVAIETIVISTQHEPDITARELKAFVTESVIEPTLPKQLLTAAFGRRPRIIINPAGSFTTGGPLGDCGLTGRKIIVDSYGGYARHGGGAFSGKDPSKVDRSAAYAARQAARSIVTSGYASHCEVQISYAIGRAKPTSIYVDTFGTGLLPDRELERLVEKTFDLTPYGIIERLDLLRPIYRQTSTYGHFGRDDLALPWEQDVNLQSDDDVSALIQRVLNTQGTQAPSKSKFQQWHSWAEAQSCYNKLNGRVCQCGTEKCIQRSRSPETMRAFLLVSIFLDQFMEKHYPHRYETYRQRYPTPRLLAHIGGGHASASWLIYSRHGYDQKIAWKIANEIGEDSLDALTDFLHTCGEPLEHDALNAQLKTMIEQEFESQHLPNVYKVFQLDEGPEVEVTTGGKAIIKHGNV